jgi:nitrate reductase gamma subunit
VNVLEAWIEFGRGPLFRLAFSLMVLGLLRVFALALIGVVEAYRRSPDRIVPWKEIARQTLGWLFPIGRLWRKRPLYGSVSLVFHAGLLLVPVFLASHILLWRRATGVGWPAIPQVLADYLTLLVVAAAAGMFLGRALHRSARSLSRFQDYVWLPLLAVPFATGYICSHGACGPRAYQAMMLAHVYSADLIMAMIPFTKIAHCVLAPLSQLVTAVAWKFVPGAGDRVAATLGYADSPTWVTGIRRAGEAGPGTEESKEVCTR